MAPDDRDRHELVGAVRPDHLLNASFTVAGEPTIIGLR